MSFYEYKCESCERIYKLFYCSFADAIPEVLMCSWCNGLAKIIKKPFLIKTDFCGGSRIPLNRKIPFFEDE